MVPIEFVIVCFCGAPVPHCHCKKHPYAHVHKDQISDEQWEAIWASWAQYERENEDG